MRMSHLEPAQARAFVSAMRPGPGPKVAGVTHYGAHAKKRQAVYTHISHVHVTDQTLGT